MKKILLLGALVMLASACQGQPVYQYDYTNSQVPTSPVPHPVGRMMKLKVAVIALNDDGKNGPKVGCGDSVVYISKTVPDSAEPLHAAFGQLFALPGEQISDPAYSDLYNVIYKLQHKSSGKPLAFSDVLLAGGTAKIYLTGDMTGLGGICDSPRVQAQIEQTALQFSTVKSVAVYLNGKLVDWKNFGSQK